MMGAAWKAMLVLQSAAFLLGSFVLVGAHSALPDQTLENLALRSIHSSPSDQRSLQTFQVAPPDGFDEDELDTVPTAAPTVDDRFQQVVVCQNPHAEVYALPTTYDFTYLVEYNIDDDADSASPVPLEEALEFVIPNLVSSATVEAVAAALCSTRDEVKNECILTVSSGTRDELVGDCANNNGGCSLYDGNIKIVHTTECSQAEVRQLALDAFVMGFETTDFLQAVNSRDLGLEVTNVDLVQSRLTAVGVGSQQQQEEMTPAGKTMIFFMVLFFVALSAILLAWRRHVVNRNRRLDDDMKSVQTAWSTPSLDNSLVQPDYHELALRHSKQDVHVCQSALCDVCRPQLGVVNMVTVPRSTSTAGLSSATTSSEAVSLREDRDPYGHFSSEEQEEMEPPSFASADLEMAGHPPPPPAPLQSSPSRKNSSRSRSPPSSPPGQRLRWPLGRSLGKSKKRNKPSTLDEYDAADDSAFYTDDNYEFVRVAEPQKAESWRELVDDADNPEQHQDTVLL